MRCQPFPYFISDARALFERVIPNFSADRARPLWERWARYEYQYGDLEAALKLEKRMAEVYASGKQNSFLFLSNTPIHSIILFCYHFNKKKILLSNDSLNDICIWEPMRLLIEILGLLWLAKRRLLTHWARARLNNRSCQVVPKARNEWLHRIIETNGKITEV